MQEQTRQAGAGQTRIDVRRIAKNILLALVLPVVLAMGVDILAGTWPFVTLIVSALAFPIAGIIVLRTMMQELNRVIEQLAPDESNAPDASAEAASVVDA